ncbi:hypothetical protein G7Y89_g15788 [Cudoniella acicularis]|uniref:Heterokaryon incompatibility domain-containing protein n=1 Tax=Cudoniella acicularis TaxID=354080 RepID=A0A8H4QFH7_9HELO|nr:hypothetical protein G7Y89_g15788 [Cudoniella acicularis]
MNTFRNLFCCCTPSSRLYNKIGGDDETWRFTYKRLNHEVHEFRLLKLLPDPSFSSKLRIEIQKATLQHPPKYEALSYVWGGPDITVPIQCGLGSQELMITTNLELALRYLRLESKSRFLWVDALCINQQDIEERNQQVTQMRRIYLEATRAVVWLGEEEDARAALEFCKTLQDRRGQSGKYADHNDPVRRDACKRLFARSWWERTWTLQEVLHNRPVEVYIGKLTISLDELCKNFEPYQYEAVSQKALQEDLDRRSGGSLSGDEEFFSITEDGQPVRTTGYEQLVKVIDPLQQIPAVISRVRSGKHISTAAIFGIVDLGRSLANFRDQKCSDPRDKVFALLGMAITTPGVVVDYSASKSIVYSTVMKAMLYCEGNPLLWVESRERPVSAIGLPSWVPDWTANQNDVARVIALLFDDFSASGSGHLSRGRLDLLETIQFDDSTLILSGIYIAIVDRVGLRSLTRRTVDGLKDIAQVFTYDTNSDRRRDKITQSADLEACRTMRNTNWGPLLTEVGDIIVVAVASTIPLVLRKRGGFYLFVGGCWLIDRELEATRSDNWQSDPAFSRIMHGSAWDESKLEKFYIH